MGTVDFVLLPSPSPASYLAHLMSLSKSSFVSLAVRALHSIATFPYMYSRLWPWPD